jgi:hypothetical protein
MTAASDLLDDWLAARLAAEPLEWLRAKVHAASIGGPDAAFLLAFSTAARRVGRANLELSPDEKVAAFTARRGWQPGPWSVDQAARTRLVLALPSDDAAAHRKTLDGLFDDADLGEQVALYQALPLLPHPEQHRERAAEGVRSNMKSVFEAVALRNPYPAESLDEAAWNQLALKVVFLGSPLHLVDGVDERVNLPLARMLSDLAHERWAAKRPVPPELWRCVGPVADGRLLADLERVIATGSKRERAAAALSARHNPNAALVLARHEAAVDEAIESFPTWDAILAPAAD